MKQLSGAFANPKKGKQNVILVEKELTDDGDILKTFKVIEDPSFSFWKSKEPKDVYETSVPIEEVDIVTTKYSQLSKTLAEITNRKKFYNKCMEGNRRDLNKLHFNHMTEVIAFLTSLFLVIMAMAVLIVVSNNAGKEKK